MTRKSERRRRRAIRDKTAEMHEDIKLLAEQGLTPGMSLEQVFELAQQSAIQILQECTRVGAVDSMPWGVVCQPPAILGSMTTMLQQLGQRFQDIDDISEDAGDFEHVQVIAALAQTLMGIAGCSILLLQSTPLPYDLIKHFIVREQEPDPDADRETNRTA